MQFDTGLDPSTLPRELLFSPSGLNTWDSCAMKGHYIYHRGFRGEYTTRALRLGSVVHRMLQLHYQGVSVAEMPSLEDEFPTEEDQMHMYSAAGLLYRYEHYYSTRENDWNILATELDITVPYTTPAKREVFLRCIIDLVVDANGRVAVVDHKTTGYKFWTAEEVWFDRQLMVYAYVLHKLGYTPSVSIINNLNTNPSTLRAINKKPDEELFSRVPSKLSVERIEGYMNEVGRNIDRILETQTYARSTGRHCKNCQFFTACGLELEGVSAESYLQANFKKGEKQEASFVIKGLPE